MSGSRIPAPRSQTTTSARRDGTSQTVPPSRRALPARPITPDLISRERQRVARDLHDVALGRLSRLGFELSAIRQSPVSSHNRGLVDAQIQAVIEDVDTLIRELRNMVFDLLSSHDPNLGIEAALRSLLQDAAAQMGSEVDLSVDGPVGSMPPSIAQHVQAVAREALRSAILHSQASHLAVALIVGEDAVELNVTDDGVGPPEVPAHGLGLGSMAARARELRGTLDFGPGATGGTVLRWRVPYWPRPGHDRLGPPAAPADPVTP